MDDDALPGLISMDEQPDPQLTFLQGLVAAHATIAGDVVELARGTWAIHGFIPVDGEVLLAEYGTPADARRALGQLPLLADAGGPTPSPWPPR